MAHWLQQLNQILVAQFEDKEEYSFDENGDENNKENYEDNENLDRGELE